MNVHPYAKNYKLRLQAYRKIFKSLGKPFEVIGACVLYKFLERYGFQCYVAYGPYWPALKDIFLKHGLLTGTPYHDRDMAASYCGATDEETIVMAEMFRDGYLSFRHGDGTYCYDGNNWSLNLYDQLAEDYFVEEDGTWTFGLDDDYFNQNVFNVNSHRFCTLLDPEMTQLSVISRDRRNSSEEYSIVNERCKDQEQTKLIDIEDLNIVEKINDRYNGYWCHDIRADDDDGYESEAAWMASVLSTMELLQMAGVNLSEVIVSGSSTREALLCASYWSPIFATNIPRIFDLKVDVIRDVYGSAIMPWSEAILFNICCNTYSQKFDTPFQRCVLNMLLLKLKPSATGAMAKIKEDLQKFQFNWEKCIDCMERYGGLTDFWVSRWFLYRKLLNYSLNRPFEEIYRSNFDHTEGLGPSSCGECKTVAYIDFFGVEDDVGVLESGDVYPFLATGIKLVFTDSSTLTIGASGHVVAVCNDVLEEKDASGRCFRWDWNSVYKDLGRIKYETYAMHRLKPGKHGEQRNGYSVCWRLSSDYMVTISKVYPADPNETAEQRLHCVIESVYDDYVG